MHIESNAIWEGNNWIVNNISELWIGIATLWLESKYVYKVHVRTQKIFERYAPVFPYSPNVRLVQFLPIWKTTVTAVFTEVNGVQWQSLIAGSIQAGPTPSGTGQVWAAGPHRHADHPWLDTSSSDLQWRAASSMEHWRLSMQKAALMRRAG